MYITCVEIALQIKILIPFFMFLFMILSFEGDLLVVMLMIFWSVMQYYFCRLATWNWFLICKKCHGSPE